MVVIVCVELCLSVRNIPKFKLWVHWGRGSMCGGMGGREPGVGEHEGREALEIVV